LRRFAVVFKKKIKSPHLLLSEIKLALISNLSNKRMSEYKDGIQIDIISLCGCSTVCQTVPHDKAKNVSKDLKGIFPLHTDIESKPEESPIQKICVCM
jgi:hypothetical protein